AVVGLRPIPAHIQMRPTTLSADLQNLSARRLVRSVHLRARPCYPDPMLRAIGRTAELSQPASIGNALEVRCHSQVPGGRTAQWESPDSLRSGDRGRRSY